MSINSSLKGYLKVCVYLMCMIRGVHPVSMCTTLLSPSSLSLLELHVQEMTTHHMIQETLASFPPSSF